jgi:hypothetical protein
MPLKPTWCGRFEEILEALHSLPHPWVDRSVVEETFRVSPRRAQQLLAPCVIRRIGTSGIADRELFIDYLRRIVSGEDAEYERRRRERVASSVTRWRKERIEQPRLLVEAPVSIVNQEFESLPDGVELGPGFVTVRFNTREEALQKLLALAMAMGRDLEKFGELTS